MVYKPESYEITAMTANTFLRASSTTKGRSWLDPTFDVRHTDNVRRVIRRLVLVAHGRQLRQLLRLHSRVAPDRRTVYEFTTTYLVDTGVLSVLVAERTPIIHRKRPCNSFESTVGGIAMIQRNKSHTPLKQIKAQSHV